MRKRLRLWMLPIIGILVFIFTTLVVAAVAYPQESKTVVLSVLFKRTQCFFGTNVYSQILYDTNGLYIMDYGIMVYRDQEADEDWVWPDLWVCTRRRER